jgi:hypothetical protein
MSGLDLDFKCEMIGSNPGRDAVYPDCEFFILPSFPDENVGIAFLLV